MGLKIKGFQEILVGMVDWVSVNSKRLIDFTEGSAIRTILEAVSTELEEYYFKSYKNMMWAMENSIYEAFDFHRKPAIPAFGTVRLTFSNSLPSSLVIPKGTKFGTSVKDKEVLYYATKQDYLVSEGSTFADVEVHCEKPGVIGNVSENAITMMTNPISFVSKVTNPDRILTGEEQETVDERKQRFNRFIETRARGTVPAILYGTKEVDGVTGAWVDESQAGLTYVYAHDASGNLSDELKKEILDNLYYYRTASMPVFVNPIVKVEMDIEVEVTVLYEYNKEEFKNNIKYQIENYLDSFVGSQDFQQSDLNNFIRRIDKVAIKNCHIKSPNGDVKILPSQLIRSGEVTVNLITAS
jgi:uncharacterized phage protein gp47/JayE